MTNHHASNQQPTPGLLLPGLDGANPLAFLAAIGLLRLLTRTSDDDATRRPPCLRWVIDRAAWRPVITNTPSLDPASLIIRLHHTLRDIVNRQPFTGDAPPALGGKITLTMKEFRSQATQAVANATIHDRRWVDWIAALACEKPAPKKDECVKSTFDFSAGQQKFLDMARSILRKTTQERLNACLFADWVYPDTGESLRWDPLDESRRYALSAIDPKNSAKNPIWTDFSANALAFAALPIFPIIEGRPIGFLTKYAWRWPLWSVPLTLDATRSLLSRKEIYEQQPPAALLRALGMETIFESSVVLPARYYRNFAPARRIV